MSQLRVMLLAAGTLAAMTTLGACSSPATPAANPSQAAPAASTTSAPASASAAPAASSKPSGTGAAAALADGAQSVYVRSINISTRIAILEPVQILSGKEYCTKHKLPASDGRCGDGIQMDASGKTYSTPIATTATFFIAMTSDGRDCNAANTGIGTCKVTAAEFSKSCVESSGLLAAQVTVTNGAVVKLAEHYLDF